MRAPTHLVTLLLTLMGIAGLFVADMFLAKADRSESQIEAARLFRQGQELMRENRSTEAVRKIEDALAIERENRNYLRSLGEAQFGSGDSIKAEATLKTVLSSDSTDGQANLDMGRVLEKQGRFSEAVSYYHRAIYGNWPQDGEANKRRARMELIDVLAQRNSKTELLAELLPLQEEAPHDAKAQARMGALFLTAGSPSHAADVFRAMVREEPRNADAYAGLGETEFTRGNYRAAQRYFEEALRLNPDDKLIKQRFDVCNEVMQMDPTVRGLDAKEHLARSVTLLKLTAQELAGCEPDHPLIKQATKVGNTEANLDLAEQIWQARKKECRTQMDSGNPLALVMARLSQ